MTDDGAKRGQARRACPLAKLICYLSTTQKQNILPLGRVILRPFTVIQGRQMNRLPGRSGWSDGVSMRASMSNGGAHCFLAFGLDWLHIRFAKS